MSVFRMALLSTARVKSMPRDRALMAWDEYVTTFDGRLPSDHPEAIGLRRRRVFLVAKYEGLEL
jgi:hypothetical protein